MGNVTRIRSVDRGSYPSVTQAAAHVGNHLGIHPHKRSHTAVVLDDCEEIVSQIRVVASASQVKELLHWAPTPERVWAVENANALARGSGWTDEEETGVRVTDFHL